MSIDRLNFEQISEADLQSLLETGVPEGIGIDYKRELYGKADPDVKEFLKDVSSFANTIGGHIIIGIEESEGIPIKIVPLVDVDADKEVLRLESMVRDGITPRIPGVRTKAVPLGAGGFAVVIRIPKSWNPPHQVSARNTNRFYVRNSAGAHEVSIDELRALFGFGVAAQDWARTFRQERLAKISAGQMPAVLIEGRGKLVLHIVPFSAFSTRDRIDLSRAYELSGSLYPVATVGYTPRYNFDGFVNIAGGDRNHGYTQVFRNGCIESVKARVSMERNGNLIIPSLDFSNHVLKILPLHLDALQALEVSPPLVIMLTLHDIYGAILGVDKPYHFDDAQPILQNTLELPDIVINDYGGLDDYKREILPAFDALWNAGGLPAYGFFNADGTWKRGG